MNLPLDPLSQDSILGLMILNQNVLTSDLTSKGLGIYYSRIFQKPSNHIWYQLTWNDSQSEATFNKTLANIQVRTGDLLPYLDPLVGNLRYSLSEFNTVIENNTADQIDGVLYKWSLGRSLLGMNPTTGTYGPQIFVSANATGTTEIIPLGTATNTARLSDNTEFSETSGNYVIQNNYPFGIQLNHIPKFGGVFVPGFTETLFNTKISGNQFYVYYSGVAANTGTNASAVNAGFVQFNQSTTGTVIDLTYTYKNVRPDAVWNYWSLPFLHNKAYISNNLDHDYLQLRIELKSLDALTNIDMYNITVSSLLKKDRQPNEIT
jgi:hypothetical protein